MVLVDVQDFENVRVLQFLQSLDFVLILFEVGIALVANSDLHFLASLLVHAAV
jgi:hypothetical protein